MDEITLNRLKSDNWLIGMMLVITNLWKDKVVYVLVTAPKTEKRVGACSYVQLTLGAFSLTGRAVLTK